MSRPLIELTPQQIADGWIAHDGGRPPEAALVHDAIDVMRRNGEIDIRIFARIHAISSHALSTWVTDPVIPNYPFDVVAWRPSLNRTAKPIPGTVVDAEFDPNAAMLTRDTPAAAPEKSPADILASVWAHVATLHRAPDSPLLTVAPIPRTGFSLWGV